MQLIILIYGGGDCSDDSNGIDDVGDKYDDDNNDNNEDGESFWRRYFNPKKTTFMHNQSYKHALC